MRKQGSLLCPFIVAVALAGLPALALSTQAKSWLGQEEHYERFLENAEIVSVVDVGEGVNQPKRITLKQGARELEALWKPIQRGPKEWAWESYEAEVAAYKMDRVLGLGMVPPTVVRSIQGQKGSLQLWVSGVKFHRDASSDAPKTPEWSYQESRMRMFDCLIGNGDRSRTNILVDNQWSLVLIDHSQAFVSSHYLNDDEDNLPHQFDRRLVARLKGLDLEYLKFRFGRLLLEPQIRAIIIRRDSLMRRLDTLAEEKGEQAVLFGTAPQPK